MQVRQVSTRLHPWCLLDCVLPLRTGMCSSSVLFLTRCEHRATIQISVWCLFVCLLAHLFVCEPAPPHPHEKPQGRITRFCEGVLFDVWQQCCWVGNLWRMFRDSQCFQQATDKFELFAIFLGVHSTENFCSASSQTNFKKKTKKKTNKNKTKQNNHQIAVQLNSSKETWTRPLTFLFRVSRSLAWQGVFTITSDHHDWLSFRAVPRCLRNRIQVPTKSWSAAVRSLQWGRQRLRFQTKIFGTTLDNVRTSLVSSYTIGKALRALLLATT